MGIFNHVSKDKKLKLIFRFDIFSDFARKDDLINYYSKSENVTFTKPVDMRGNKINSL